MMHRYERRMVLDGRDGPSSENDPNKDMLPGEPTTNANPTSATSNPGTVGGGSMSQAAGGKDEGTRGREAANVGIGGFGQATKDAIQTADVAGYTPSLLTLGLPLSGLMMRGVDAARRAGLDVKDVTTNPDGGNAQSAERTYSKIISRVSDAEDAAQRSSNIAAASGSTDQPSLLNATSTLNRNGYASGNRRRRSLFDTGSGSMTLGGI